MLYILIIATALCHYYKWMWKKLNTLRDRVKIAQKTYTITHELDFLSLVIDAKRNPDTNSILGLHKSQPEYKVLVENRVRYFEELCKLRELQRAMFMWEDIDMETRDEDDNETWSIKMTYGLGINKKKFFSYYPEYLRSIFEIK
jgi:hypothetical protein